MSLEFGIYVHVPFCRRKCGYCDFHSIPLSRTDQGTVDLTLDRIRSEIEGHESLIAAAGADPMSCNLPSVTSIYIGGGTPSAVPADGVGRIILAACSSFTTAEKLEVTVEVNPDTATETWLRTVFEAGANRLSIGAQSMNEAVLNELGRPHGSGDVAKAVKAARSAGFTNISIDLIYGSPSESLESWETTIDLALALKPEHFSVYGLTIPLDVPMAAELGCLHGSVGAWELEREDTQLAMHDLVGVRLGAAGYPRYEICSYGPEEYRSRHNLNYWAQGGYLGFGPGAHSHLPSNMTNLDLARRWWDGRTIEEYATGTGSPVSDMDIVDDSAARTEMVYLALRTTEGLDLSKYAQVFGASFSDDFEAYGPLLEGDLLACQDNRVFITAKGWPVADHVMSRLL